LFFIVSQKSSVPHPRRRGWDKTFLDSYSIIRKSFRQ
jgi:hypothetical protein